MSRKKINKTDLDLKKIGSRIAFIRLDHGLTHEDFSKNLEISKGNISDIENDKHNPSYVTIIRIIERYNANPTWLLAGEGQVYSSISTEIADEPGEIGKLARMTVEILKSDTDYADSLAANIRSFHKSIQLERRTTILEEKCDDLIEEVHGLKSKIEAKEKKEVVSGGQLAAAGRN